MSVPTYDQFIEPLLRWLVGQRREVRASEAHEAVALELGLSDEDKAERLPSGGQTVYANRNGWAHDRLKRAGFSSSSRRGVWQATREGIAFVAAHPAPLSKEAIAQVASLGTSKEARPSDDGSVDHDPSGVTPFVSPEDRIDQALEEIRDSVAHELLEMILQEPPAFFERLVLDLLHAMGYGVSRAALQTVGGSGDGGIDGIISLDRLGLQKVYVQAKRWKNTVSSPTVRDFIGALTTQGAHQGVLLTTSDFTRDAVATAEKVRSGTIVLVDGRRLAHLMIDHGVGVSHRALRIPKIDGDYFEG